MSPETAPSLGSLGVASLPPRLSLLTLPSALPPSTFVATRLMRRTSLTPRRAPILTAEDSRIAHIASAYVKSLKDRCSTEYALHAVLRQPALGLDLICFWKESCCI